MKLFLTSLCLLLLIFCMENVDAVGIGESLVNLCRQAKQSMLNRKSTSTYKLGAQLPKVDSLVLEIENANGSKISLAELEAGLRPGPRSFQSITGFIAANENFVEVLRAQNQMVKALGKTNSQIHRRLLSIIEKLAGEYYFFEPSVPEVVRLKDGSEFKVEVIEFGGAQLSPFRDGAESSREYRITSLKNSKTVTVPGLVVDWTAFGFYEGAVPHSVDPRELVAVLFAD